MKEIYRFRNTDNLIRRFKELENQEIYFAAPEELNDPIEGYRDVYWKGDSIVWKNFILNYIKTFEQIFRIYCVVGETKKIGEIDIIDSFKLARGLTPFDNEILNKICLNIFKISFIHELPGSLSKRSSPIRRSELFAYLQIIHSFIINEVSKVYFEKGLTTRQFLKRDLTEFENILSNEGGFPQLFNQLEDTDGTKTLDIFLNVIAFTSQTKLLETKKDIENNKSFENSLFLISEFPNAYLDKIIRDIYPPWYSASFLSNCKNSAIWGHYGDNHKGVCLIFKVSEDEKGNYNLKLKTEYGYGSGPIIGMRPHKFIKVEYEIKPIEIDFFRSIGRLTKFELNKLWYKDEHGNESECAKHLIQDEKKWGENYWDDFLKSYSIKLKEWEYEIEYRLVVHGDFVDYSEKKSRKLEYDFNDLRGIIFGIRTPSTEKIEIMKIIKEKCKINNIKDFKFYQAFYSRTSAQIETFKLPNF